MDAKAESAREVELNAKSHHHVSRRDITFADRLEAALKPRGFAPLIDCTVIRARKWISGLSELFSGTEMGTLGMQVLQNSTA